MVLSSQAHRVADVDLDDPNFERQAYDPFVAYGRSKTANSSSPSNSTGGTGIAAFELLRSCRGIVSLIFPAISRRRNCRVFSRPSATRAAGGSSAAGAERNPPGGRNVGLGCGELTKRDRRQVSRRLCGRAVNDTPNPFADGSGRMRSMPARPGNFGRNPRHWSAQNCQTEQVSSHDTAGRTPCDPMTRSLQSG